jgi:hypothetical protein
VIFSDTDALVSCADGHWQLGIKTITWKGRRQRDGGREEKWTGDMKRIVGWRVVGERPSIAA